jgi:hypothetical protein
MAADERGPADIKKPKDAVKDLDVPEEELEDVKGGAVIKMDKW